MDEIEQVQIDMATAVVRMEQAWAERDTALGAVLLMRLATCDAPRLRRHLTPEAAALIEEYRS